MVKLLQHISIAIVGIIYLLSSSGILIYKTNCSCMGTEQVSVFMLPETCESDFHQHHNHDASGEEISVSCNECHECSNQEHSCGCSYPEVKFFKLVNQFLDDDTSYIHVKTSTFLVAFNKLYCSLIDEPDKVETEINHFSPPPIRLSTLEFLIQINQLKIPNIA